MRIEDTYNIHCFLYDILHIGTHHFKSKLLCKLGFHNYQIHCKRIPLEPVVEEDNHFKRIEYRFEYKTYWKCYCCGKEEELID